MAYDTSKFGNGTDVGSGGNVTTSKGTPHNYFGPRDDGGTVGVLKVEGAIEQLVLIIEGTTFNDLLEPLQPTYLPAGTVIRDVWIDVEDVFALTGTNPTILIGTDTTEVTNGFVVSEAVAESANTARLTGTLTGTWAVNTPIQARTKIGYAIGGTGGPVVSRTGKARVTIEYIRPNRVPPA